jgi:hypothetical protein
LSKKTNTTTKQKILDFISNIWRNMDFKKPDDTKFTVQSVSSLDEVLLNEENILWQGSPLSQYSWGDHDMLGPVGSTYDQPQSLWGRIIYNIFSVLFISCLTLAGVVSIFTGIEELLAAKSFGKLFGGGLLILFGSTLMSSISILFTPFINMQRAFKMQYLLTNKRCLVIRKGHDWGKIWGKSLIIFNLSLLLLFGVLGFTIILFQGIYIDIFYNSSFNSLVARVVGGILLFPLGAIFFLMAYAGMRYQPEIIIEAIKSRNKFFIRSFYHKDSLIQDYPMVSRIRGNGVGDVILAADVYYDYVTESSTVHTHVIPSGFLSVANAKLLEQKIQNAIQ